MRSPRFKNFDLNLLRVFDAVYQHGTVNTAAGELGVSPSAVSHALGRLRYLFDDDLFVKGSSGMTPTARAANIAEGVASALMQVNAVFEPLDFKPDIANRHFKLRCNQYVGWLAIPHVVQDLRIRYPDVSITVQVDDMKGVADDLDTGAIDLVLSSFAHIPDRFETEFLFTDTWVWATSATNPILAQNLSEEQLIEMPQVVLATSEVARSIDGVVSEAGLGRGVISHELFLSDANRKSRYSAFVRGAAVTNAPLMIAKILGHSDLVAALPAMLIQSLAEPFQLRIIRPFADGKPFDSQLMWHRKHGQDAALTWLRSVIQASVASWFSEWNARYSGPIPPSHDGLNAFPVKVPCES